MTIEEQMREITERVIREAREQLLIEADRQEVVNRVYSVPEDAVEARAELLARLGY